MRYLWKLVAAAAVAGGVAAGASTTASAQDEGLRMLVSAGSSGRAFAAIGDMFTEQTGIPVRVEEMPLADLRQRQILDLVTGAGQIDVVVLNNAWLGELSSRLVDLSPEMVADGDFDPDAIVPSMLDLFAEGDAQYALPVRVGGRVLAYRTDLFETAGISEPPRTWDEFIDVAQQLTDSEQQRYGFVAPLRQNVNMVDTWAVFVTSFGGSFVDESGLHATFGEDVGLAATQTFVDLYNTHGVMPPDAIEFEDDGAISAMQTGRAAMLIAYSPWVSQLNDPERSQVAGNIDVAPYLPSADGEPGISMTNGWGFGVSASSRSQEDAIAFVKFAVSPEVQLAIARSQNNDPTVSAVYQDEAYLQANPFAPNILVALDGAIAQPSSAGWAAVSEELSRALSLAVTDQQSVEQVLDEATQRADALLSR